MTLICLYQDYKILYLSLFILSRFQKVRYFVLICPYQYSECPLFCPYLSLPVFRMSVILSLFVLTSIQNVRYFILICPYQYSECPLFSPYLSLSGFRKLVCSPYLSLLTCIIDRPIVTNKDSCRSPVRY